MFLSKFLRILSSSSKSSSHSNEASSMPMETVVISLSDADVMSGEEVTVSVAIDNQSSVGGIQIDFVDSPNNLTVLSAEGPCSKSNVS